MRVWLLPISVGALFLSYFLFSCSVRSVSYKLQSYWLDYQRIWLKATTNYKSERKLESLWNVQLKKRNTDSLLFSLTSVCWLRVWTALVYKQVSVWCWTRACMIHNTFQAQTFSASKTKQLVNRTAFLFAQTKTVGSELKANFNINHIALSFGLLTLRNLKIIIYIPRFVFTPKRRKLIIRGLSGTLRCALGNKSLKEVEKRNKHKVSLACWKL